MESEQRQEPIRPPEKLTSAHQLEDFDSGIEQLDTWLKRRALGNEAEGASRTYVVCAGEVVVGYYCLANGAVANNLAPGKVRRNMPDPIPVMIIGRLAVDRRWQGQGIGKGLLRDAILRTLKPLVNLIDPLAGTKLAPPARAMPFRHPPTRQQPNVSDRCNCKTPTL